MRNIKTYSKKFYTLKINTFYYNPISLFKSCNLSDKDFFPFNIETFNYEFEKRHGLLNLAEHSENYSYS